MILFNLNFVLSATFNASSFDIIRDDEEPWGWIINLLMPNFSMLRGQLYSQLSSDIQTNKTLERRFYLVQELSTAANNDINIKKLFWKVRNLFRYFVNSLLQKVTPILYDFF